MSLQSPPSFDCDRSFDAIAEHFEKKVYGGLKGQIRLAVLWRDLTQQLEQLPKDKPLRILDVGAGLAQLSIRLAQLGHQVTVNDISPTMLQKAKLAAGDIAHQIQWQVGAYQDLTTKLGNQQYDLILCHAVLEWLAKPQQIIPFFKQQLTPTGLLSLCFYNPASFVYRNLIMGNFNVLTKATFKADKGSLTPNNPVSYDDVQHWLHQTGFNITSVSGLRVFHDYSPLKRGGHTNPEAVLQMELTYASQEPFKWLGRYLHVLAKVAE